MATIGDMVYYALRDGPPAAALLLAMDVPKRKLRYPLKWVFISLLVANLAGIAAVKLLSFSGVLIR